MNWKRLLKRTVKWGAIALTALLFSLVILFGLAQTELGKRQLASLIARTMASRVESRIEVGKLSGLVPFNFKLDYLGFSDADGPWMAAEGVVLHWSPLALIKGQISIYEFSVDRVKLNRVPKGKGRAAGPSIMKLPTWPAAFPSMRVNRLFISQLAVDKSLMGEAALFNVEAKIKAELAEDLKETHIRIERIDGPKMKLLVQATLLGERPQLTARASFEEGQNGFVASALGSPGPLAFSLQGEGPLREWKGMFRADFPPVGQCESEILLDLSNQFKVNAQGTLVFIPGHFPKALAVWLGPDARFSITGGSLRRGVMALDRVTLETGDMALGLSGTLDLNWNRLKGQFTITCNDLGPWGTLTKVPLAGRLKAEGSISGTLLKPEGDVHFTLDNMVLDRFHFSKMGGKFHLEFLEPLRSTSLNLRLNGKGKMEKLTLQGLRFPAQREVQWTLDIEGLTKEIFHIKTLKAESEKISLGLSGRVDPKGGKGQLAVVLEMQDLEPIADFFGVKLPKSSSIRLNANVEGDMRRGPFSARIHGNGHILDDEWGPVVGKELSYSGNIALEKENLLTLTDFQVKTATGTLNGNVSYDFGSRILKAASWHLNFPNLLALSPALHRPIEGSLEMNGRLDGPLQNIRISADGVCQNLLVDSVRLGKTTAAFHATGLPPKSAGRFSIQVNPSGRPIGAKADFALDGDRLALTSILLKGVTAELTGKANLYITKMLAEGELKGRCENLSVLSTVLDKKIEGSADIAVNFEIIDSNQRVTFTLEGQNVAGPFGRGLQLVLSGQLNDAFKSPKGSGKLEIKDLLFRDMTLSSSQLVVEGDLAQVNFTAIARGHYKEDFELEGSGTVSSGPSGQKMELNRLQAQYGDLPVALADPVMIVWSKPALSVDPFNIKVGSGMVRGQGRIGKPSIALDMAFQDLSVGICRYFGIPFLTGTATGTVVLRGASDQPQGLLKLRIDKLSTDATQFADFPLGTLEVNVKLDEKNRLKAEAFLQGLTAKPFKISTEFPIVLSLWPLVFSVPPQGELSGHLDGEIDLARIPSLLRLDDQKLAGQMDLNLSLGGDAKNPKVEGKILVQKGTYENLRSGTMLKDLDMRIAGSAPRLTIEQARATDGEDGIIIAQGWLDILPSQGFPFKLELALEHAKPFRHDLAFATVGGKLTLSGSFNEATLTGNIIFESAEFRIPRRLPPEIADVEVIEINKGPEPVQALRKKKAPKGDMLKLSITVGTPGRTFVRGRSLDSEWEGELNVMGTATKPIITGRLSLVRGRFNFLGKRFSLTRGSISFHGMTPPSPVLNMLGEARTKEITARLELSGPLQSPELKLSSEPSFPADEILSRLLFGRSATQITPLQAIQLANAMNSMTAGGGLDFMGRTREVLRLDQLEVKQSGDKLEDPSLSAGKYMSDTIYLEVEQGLGPDSGKASLQWEITPNISVGTEAGVNAEVGVGVNWKWDY